MVTNGVMVFMDCVLLTGKMILQQRERERSIGEMLVRKKNFLAISNRHFQFTVQMTSHNKLD